MIGGSWSFIIERSTKRKGHRVETPEETRYAEEPEPSTVRVRGIAVSYTHLKLPTNREV